MELEIGMFPSLSFSKRGRISIGVAAITRQFML
jgi:hypothetical protein